MAKKTSPLTPYGYPSSRSIRRQARNLAAASVTPASEIRHQYKQSQNDASGFTQALIGLLGGQQSAYNNAADSAVSQQQAIDSAAVSRLGGVDPTLVAGVQDATGALGDTAASRTVAQGLALKGYGAQQPGIAASRGALAQLGLTNAMQQALQQRRVALHQAFMQAVPQVQQNALNMATAAANIDLNNRQLQAQIAQANASLGERAREFNISSAQSDKHFWANLAAQYGGTSAIGKNGVPAQPWKNYNMTPTQWRSADTDARQGAAQAEYQGVTVEQYLQRAIQINNIPPELALKAVRIVYGGLKGANQKTQPAKYKLYQDYVHWLQSQPAYKAAQERRNQRNRVRGGRGPVSGE